MAEDSSDIDAGDNSDADSVFGEEAGQSKSEWMLQNADNPSKQVRQGTRVKLQITQVVITEGKLISNAKLL